MEGGQRCSAHTRMPYLQATFGTAEWDDVAAMHASNPKGAKEIVADAEDAFIKGDYLFAAACDAAVTRGDAIREANKELAARMAQTRADVQVPPSPLHTSSNARLDAAATYLQKHGWNAGEWEDDDGTVSLAAAVHKSGPADGTTHVVNQILAARNLTDDINIETGAYFTGDEILDGMSAEVTHAEMENVFGPQWEQVIVLTDQAATFSADKHVAFLRAQSMIEATPDQQRIRRVAKNALHVADGDCSTARGDARRRATTAVVAAVDGNIGPHPFIREAAHDAVLGLTARHLIGQHGFTHADYHALTHPWSTVMDPVPPHDEVRTAA